MQQKQRDVDCGMRKKMQSKNNSNIYKYAIKEEI